MKDIILKRIQELTKEFNEELKNGSKEYATDRCKELRGEIRGLNWVFNLITDQVPERSYRFIDPKNQDGSFISDGYDSR